MVHRRAAIIALVSGMVAGITTALQPYLIGVIIDHISHGPDMTVILDDVIILLALAVITVVAFYYQRNYSGEIAYLVSYDVREMLFRNLLTLDQGFYHHFPMGDLISRMYADVDMIWRLLALGFNQFGSAALTVVVAFALLGIINLPLTVLVFIVLTVSTAFQIRAGLALVPMFEKVQDQAGVVSAFVQDSVSGVQTVKTFGKERGVSDAFHDEVMEYRRRWLFFKRRNEPVGMLPNMISELTTGIVVLSGGLLAVSGTLTLGNFAQFLMFLGLIGTVLLQLGTIYQRLQQTRGALLRLTPILQPAEIRSTPNAVALPTPRGDIAFENVSLMMDNEWLLRDVSLEIPAGSVVAFVGPTGCGKTLLVSLLARVIDSTKGRVLIDGVDVRELHLEDLRAAIAYVPQSTFLFSQPLHENVRMGRDHVSDEDLDRAIHIARVSNDLQQLPEGLETLVGERGVMLSGGQKQRVAIARALVRDPAILVLDDALSSVDTQTAAEILADLRDVLETRTSLIIAHRIATVKDADRIIVMNEGQIVEQGTHESLIAANGLYARMVDRELRGDHVDED